MKQLCMIALACLLMACQKKELPVPKYDRGDVISSQVEMGQDYRYQVWFSLQDDKVVSVNLKTDWDLSFEASPTGFHVMLNGAKSMRAYKTTATNLANVTDTAGLGFNGKADVPSGNLDSTAIGDWQANNAVYVINRGYNELGQLQGFYKLKISSNAANRYDLEFADIASGQVYQASVNKDDSRNFAYFSFTTKTQVAIEPARLMYDLCFTQYTHIFTDPFQYYQVTGILINSYNTRVAKFSTKAFADVNINDTLGLGFMSRRDAIGYDWKTFDLNSNLYTVNPKDIYLICDNKGFYYKLHFVDFYNSAGLKGYPKFEYKKL